MKKDKREQINTLEHAVFDVQKKGETAFKKEIKETMYTVPGFDDVFKKYKEIKGFAEVIAEFMQIHGGTSLNVYDTGTEGIILQIGTNENAGGFLIKCSRSGYDIKKETANHKTFYEVFLEEKQKLEYVEIPHIVDDLSDKFDILIMDKLPGKTVWRLLIEHFFSPIFQKYDLENTPDGEVRILIDNISEIVEKQQGDPSAYIDKGYNNDLETEYATYKEQKNIFYKNKNSFFTYKLMEDAKYWNIERKQDIDAINLLLEDKGKNMISGIKQFQNVCKQHNMSHDDLHSGNVMVIPQKDGSYKVGIIDFGKVSLSKK